jgi:hypothetical protein
MNPTDWQPYVSMAKDAITAAAAVTAAIVAIQGLRAWRKQLRGKTDYELARRCLRAVYRLRDAIRFIRNPIITSEEISKAVRDEGASIPAEFSDDYKIAQAVYNLRLKVANEALSDLQVELLEAQVSWGNDAVAAIEPLQQCLAHLFGAIRRHLRRLASDRRLTPKTEDELEQILYEMEGGFSNDIAKAVTIAEKFLQPHLRL